MPHTGSLTWQPGKLVLDEYIIDSVLGEGGMGIVYCVRRISDGFRLAMKTLHDQNQNKRSSRLNFIRELRLWNELPDHPNLVPCFFFRTIEGRLAIFSEYIDGQTLTEWIKKTNPVTHEKILDLAIQVAWGLSVAHDREVIHLDIKPANILMTRDGVPKLTDFGIARSGIYLDPEIPDQPNESDTTGTHWMTPAYCSPEQLFQKPVDHRSDIWSLGLVILEMYLGQRNWTTGVLARFSLDSYDPSMYAGRPVVERAVLDVLEKCFNTSPERRWKNIHELIHALTKTYVIVTGMKYSREKPKVLASDERPVALLNRHTSNDLEWADPSYWLMESSSNTESGMAKIPNQTGYQDKLRRQRVLEDLENFEQALQEYSLQFKNGQIAHTEELARLLHHKALVHIDTGDLYGAEELLGQAIEIWDRLDSGSSNTCPEHIKSCLIRANVLRDMTRYADAVTWYARATSLAASQPDNGPTDSKLESMSEIFFNSALALSLSGDFPAAVRLFERTITLQERLVQTQSSQQMIFRLANSYMHKGNALSAFRDYRSAIRMYDRAIDLWRRIPVSGYRDSITIDLVMLLKNKANALISLGDHSVAAQLLQGAISAAEILEKKEGWLEIKGLIATCQTLLADCLHAAGRNNESIAEYDRAIEILEKLVNREGDCSYKDELVMAYQAKARIIEAEGDRDMASDLIDKATAMIGREGSNSTPPLLALQIPELQHAKARLLRESGDIVASETCYREALKIWHEQIYENGRMELLGEYAAAKTGLADLLRSTNRVDEARAEYQIAIPILQYEVERTGRSDLAKLLTEAFLQQESLE